MPCSGKGKKAIKKVMEKFEERKLRTGSKKGPKVKNKKQAIAIALSEKKKAGGKAKAVAKKK